MIYFDHAATTPVHPEVVEVVRRVLSNTWGNPSSLHHKGLEAEKALEGARAALAAGLGVKPRCLTFTSCATESNNTVLHGVLGEPGTWNLVVAEVEHSSIHAWAKEWEKRGGEVRRIPVDAYGRIEPQAVVPLVDDRTALVCAMQVNNELGTCSPVEEIAEAVHRKNARTRVLVDGVQGFGKLPLSKGLGEIDFYTASGHKIRAPKGIGLLYVREGVSLPPLMVGGGQERGLRPGTENVAFACAMAKAYELMQQPNEVAHLYARARARAAQCEGVRCNSPKDGSPYILNLGFTDIRSEVLLHFMEQEQMYLSSGSACSGGARSHVLQAVGIPAPYRDGCIRISFQAGNTLEEVDRFFDALEKAVGAIRAIVTRVGRSASQSDGEDL